MTEPMSPQSDVVAASTVEEVRDNASALQLTWGVRFATVISVDSQNSSVLRVTLDGDAGTVLALSLIGTRLIGERCAVIDVPPSGLYVIAALGAASFMYQARQTLISSAASVTFSGIPANLRRLDLNWSARSTAVGQVHVMVFRVNGVSTSVYSSEAVQANNAAVVGVPNLTGTSGRIGVITGSSVTAGIYGSGRATFEGWDSPHSSTLNWNFQTSSIGVGAANFYTESGGGVVSTSEPYTTLELIPSSGSFASDSDFQLTGWYT